MRKIILIIFSFCLIHSSQSLAGIGDVYYCTTSQFVGVATKNVKRYTDLRFTFKRTGQYLSFGKNEYWDFLTLGKLKDEGKEYFLYHRRGVTFEHVSDGFFNFISRKLIKGEHEIDVAVGSCSVF